MNICKLIAHDRLKNISNIYSTFKYVCPFYKGNKSDNIVIIDIDTKS